MIRAVSRFPLQTVSQGSRIIRWPPSTVIAPGRTQRFMVSKNLTYASCCIRSPVARAATPATPFLARNFPAVTDAATGAPTVPKQIVPYAAQTSPTHRCRGILAMTTPKGSLRKCHPVTRPRPLPRRSLSRRASRIARTLKENTVPRRYFTSQPPTH